MNEESLTPREAVNVVLSQYGKRYGQAVTLDDEGNCAIQFGPDIAVGVEVPAESDLFLLYTPIAPIPFAPEARDDVFQAALSRNLVQQTLGGGAIALDPDGQILIYATSRKVDELDEAALDAMFEAALEAVVEVREEIGFDPETLAPETFAPETVDQPKSVVGNDSADTVVKV